MSLIIVRDEQLVTHQQS